MKKSIIFLFLTTFSLVASAQKKDSLNVTDKTGKKQGHWVKPYASGSTFYDGQFKDDVPYGQFKYYYESGQLQTIVNFSDNGQTRRAKMYFMSGVLMAEGKYIGEKRDSLWKFYNDYGYYISNETYKSGKKEGMAYIYFIDSLFGWG